MSRNLLKTELSILERQFPRTHGVFQMISTSSEELVCQFTDIKQKKHTFQCNLSVCVTGSRTISLPYHTACFASRVTREYYHYGLQTQTTRSLQPLWRT